MSATMTDDRRALGVAPDRSLAQRLDALERANDVRIKRSALKRDIKAGRVSIADVLAAPPPYLATAKVVDILLAAPTFGKVKVSKTVTQCHIERSRTVAGLSQRQHGALVDLLRR